MEVTGHRTADVFRRYDITDLSDLEEVAEGMDMDALRLSQGSAKVEAEKPSNSP